MGVRRFVPALLSLVFLLVTVVAATLPFAVLARLANPRFSGFTPAGFGGALIVLAGALGGRDIVGGPSLLRPDPGGDAGARRLGSRSVNGAGPRCVRQIMLVSLIGGLISGAPLVFVGVVQAVVGGMHDRGQVPFSLVALIAILAWIAAFIVGPFGNLLNTALHHDRRHHLEGSVRRPRMCS